MKPKIKCEAKTVKGTPCPYPEIIGRLCLIHWQQKHDLIRSKMTCKSFGCKEKKKDGGYCEFHLEQVITRYNKIHGDEYEVNK